MNNRKVLKKRGFDIGWLDAYYFSHNYYNHPIIKFFTDNPDLLNVPVDDDGNTILHLALFHRNDTLVTWLINHPRIDFTVQTKYGNSLVDTARVASPRWSEYVLQLLREGKDPPVNFV